MSNLTAVFDTESNTLTYHKTPEETATVQVQHGYYEAELIVNYQSLPQTLITK